MDYEKAVKVVLEQERLFQYKIANVRGQQLKTFVNTPQNLVELLKYGKERRQWKEFLIYENDRISYDEFLVLVKKVANYLQQEMGVKKGQKIAVAMRNYPEYSILFMAIISIGAVIVFVNAWWTTEEMEYGFEDSGAKICFADEERVKTISPFSKEKNITLISVRFENNENLLSYEKIVSNDDLSDLIQPIINSDDDFGVMYTSGSTGNPKGVVLTHRGAISAVFSWLMVESVGAVLDPEKSKNRKPASILLLSPLFHVNGSHPNFLYSMAKGAKLIFMYKWDPMKGVNLIEKEQVTLIRAVPTVVSDLVEEAIAQKKSLSSLEGLNAGGAKRPPSRVAYEKKALPYTDITSGYGMTETNALGLGVSGDEYLENPELAGRLIPPLQELKIVNEKGLALQSRQVGEIALKSPTNMRCYLNKQDATDEVLKNGWMHTGDLGYTDDNGMVIIVDRKKNIIIRGGENISCLEVEGAIQSHTYVIESIVFPVPSKRFGEEVGVCIHLKRNQKLSKYDVAEFLQDKIAKFKIPVHYWWATKSLPRGATDKLDRILTKKLCLDNEWEKFNGSQ